MNNLIKESLTKLKQININNPELDLRILLKHASKKNNEIILSNLGQKSCDYWWWKYRIFTCTIN